MLEKINMFLHRPLWLISTVFLLFIVGVLSYKIMDATVMAKPSFCATCHNMEFEYNTYVNDGLLAHKHAEADVTCHDCHEPSIGQQMNEGWLFVTGQYDNPTPKYGFTNEQCLSCHKWEEVVAKTADKYGASSPHEGEHEQGNEPPLCMDCHSVHHKQSVQKCNTCHPTEWDVDSSWAVEAK